MQFEKLGRSEVTLYSATRYVLPFHSDSDNADGYCWCKEWEGNYDTDNFAFVMDAFSIYFATESNCFCVRDQLKYVPTESFWSLLNAVRKYISSPTTRKGVYLSRISMFRVVYKVKNK
jgi:hypothetical protein